MLLNMALGVQETNFCNSQLLWIFLFVSINHYQREKNIHVDIISTSVQLAQVRTDSWIVWISSGEIIHSRVELLSWFPDIVDQQRELQLRIRIKTYNLRSKYFFLNHMVGQFVRIVCRRFERMVTPYGLLEKYHRPILLYRSLEISTVYVHTPFISLSEWQL